MSREERRILDRLIKARDKMANIIIECGTSYAPIFQRIEAEIAARQEVDPVERVRLLINAESRK